MNHAGDLQNDPSGLIPLLKNTLAPTKVAPGQLREAYKLLFTKDQHAIAIFGDPFTCFCFITAIIAPPIQGVTVK